MGTPSSPERAKHLAQKQAFLASLEPFNKALANAHIWEAEAAREAWLNHVQSSVSKYAPSFAALDEMDRTYHPPAKVTGRQRVTVRGTATDGSGRTVDASFYIEP
jgi:hypothetical protein